MIFLTIAIFDMRELNFVLSGTFHFYSQMGMDSLYIVYPEKKFVSSDKVIGWAQDSWDTEPEGDRPTNLADSIRLLEDRGEVTFARATHG